MLWIKAFHIIFVVCWFAGLFYLPRLFVYHAMAEDQATRQHLLIMEQKLYRFVTPFAVLTVVFGAWLISYNVDYYLTSHWLLLKVFLVVLLVVYHLVCGRIVKQLQAGASPRSHVFYRWFNEAPVLALIPIVILVVVKPFG